MVTLDCTLLNFSDKDVLFSFFDDYSNDFDFTANGVSDELNLLYVLIVVLR